MHIFKKGDPDYHIPLNANFSDVVSKSSNETIAGIKNFKDGLQVNGVDVSKAKYAILRNPDLVNNAAKIPFGTLSIDKQMGAIVSVNKDAITILSDGVYSIDASFYNYKSSNGAWTQVFCDISNNGALVNYWGETKSFTDGPVRQTAILELQKGAVLKIGKHGTNSTGDNQQCRVLITKIGER